MIAKIRAAREALYENDFVIVTVSLLLIGTVGITWSGAQSFEGVEPARVSHVIELNEPYGIVVLKTLGSRKILVEKDGKTLKCETPTTQSLEARSPLLCSEDTTINHK